MRASHSLLIATLAAAAAAACGAEAGEPREVVLPVFAVQPSSNFVAAPLTGAAERPTPVETRARGSATFRLSRDGTTMSYRLIAAGLEGITQAHIHIGPPDDAGPFVVFLFDFVAAGVDATGVLAEGTFTEADLIARAQIAFGGTMEELLDEMRSGNAYVNVHTLDFPAGEIRGQVREAGPTK